MNTPGGNIKYDYFQNAFNIKGSLDSIWNQTTDWSQVLTSSFARDQHTYDLQMTYNWTSTKTYFIILYISPYEHIYM